MTFLKKHEFKSCMVLSCIVFHISQSFHFECRNLMLFHSDYFYKFCFTLWCFHTAFFRPTKKNYKLFCNSFASFLILCRCCVNIWICTCLFRTVQNYFCYVDDKDSVTDFLTQRGPSAESVTRPVEFLGQRVSSSPPFLYCCPVSCTRLCNSYFEINLIATQSVLETVSVNAKI